MRQKQLTVSSQQLSTDASAPSPLVGEIREGVVGRLGGILLLFLLPLALQAQTVPDTLCTYHGNGDLNTRTITWQEDGKHHEKVEGYSNNLLSSERYTIDGNGEEIRHATRTGHISSITTLKDGKKQFVKEYNFNTGELTGSIAYEENKKTKYHPNGILWHTETYKDGKLDGEVRVYDQEGKLRGFTTYQNGKKHGLSITYHSNGKIEREEVFENDKTEGMLTIYYYDGGIYMTLLHHAGKLKEIKQYDEETGILRKEETYEAGKLDGYRKLYYWSGELQFASVFVAGQREGTSYNYHQSGRVATSTEFIGDKAEGRQIKYYDSEDNRKEMECTYQNDRLHGEYKTYYLNGQLMEHKNYKNGMQSGPEIAYYDDGQKKYEYADYEEDMPYGAHRSYSPKGRLVEEMYFEAGKQHGPHTTFKEDGTVLKRTMYKHGEEVGKKKTRRSDEDEY